MAINKSSAVCARWAVEIDDGVQCLAWSPDGRWLAAAAVSGPIALIETATGEVKQRWPGHSDGTLALSWSPDSQRVASSGQDGFARVWNPNHREEQQRLAGGSSWVGGVSFSPYANLVVTAAGKELRAWDLDGQLRQCIKPHASTITDLAWHPQQTLLASSAFGNVHLWDWQNPETPQQRLLPHPSSLLNARWSPNGLYLACGCQDSSLRCWTWPDQQDFQMSGYVGKIATLAWDPTSRWLATPDADAISLWDFSKGPPTNSSPLDIEGPADPVRDLAFQATGQRLAAGTQSGQLFIWDIDADGYRALWQGKLRGGFQRLVWHPQERLLAVGGADGAVAAFEFLR